MKYITPIIIVLTALFLTACSEELIDALNSPSPYSRSGYYQSTPYSSSSPLGQFPKFDEITTQ